MVNKELNDIIENLVKTKVSELSSWENVRYGNFGRLYYEINAIQNQISKFNDLDISILYLEKLLCENFIVQDNLPSSAPDITQSFRNKINEILSDMKIQKININKKIKSTGKKKRIPIPNKIKILLQKEINSKCPFCINDEVEHFQFHHIDENPENNQIKNLIMLCPICHSKIHNKEISLEDINKKKT